jgi:signal transduction histidine kinase
MAGTSVATRTARRSALVVTGGVWAIFTPMAGLRASDEGTLNHLIQEQAALRRVATLVARGAPAETLFAVVAEQVAEVLRVPLVSIVRYDPDGAATERASVSPRGAMFPVGTRWSLEGTNVVAQVLESGRPARIDDYSGLTGAIAEACRSAGIRSTVGSPIAVAGRLWGAMIVSSAEPDVLPPDTEARLVEFTELVATAIANGQAREEVERLADEQAALRRVATLVARGATQAEVFTAIAQGIVLLLGPDEIRMVRYEDDHTAVVVASSGTNADDLFPVGSRTPLGVDSAATRVFQTGQPVRIDDYGTATRTITEAVRSRGIRGAVATPIWVEGRLWGSITAGTRQLEPLPRDTESRLAEFTELMATAISNIEARSDLAASRARIMVAADEERRRVVRDLHDGAQQRMVHAILVLGLAQQALERQDEEASGLVTEAVVEVQRAMDELRELAQGLVPSVLRHGGLAAGVKMLVSRVPVPVEAEVFVDRLPAAVEATAYFVVAEALTNVAKHSRAGRAQVTADVRDGTLRVRVHDDGVGGARPGGSGLLGLADRVAALDGQLHVDSPADEGTLVAADIPL